MNKVKGFRVMVGMTQEEMANAIGVSVRAYINKEIGKSEFTIGEFKQIKDTLNSRGLNLTVSDLF